MCFGAAPARDPAKCCLNPQELQVSTQMYLWSACGGRHLTKYCKSKNSREHVEKDYPKFAFICQALESFSFFNLELENGLTLYFFLRWEIISTHHIIMSSNFDWSCCDVHVQEG